MASKSDLQYHVIVLPSTVPNTYASCASGVMCIFHDIFGPTAIENLSYRFSFLKDKPDQLQRCKEIFESMMLEMSIFRVLKKSGDTLVHKDGTPISAADLQDLIIPRIGSRHSSAFMRRLSR